MLTPNQIRKAAKRLLELADALEASPIKPPTPQPEPKSAAERVQAALQRAPSYADRWPDFAPMLTRHAMTKTMIRRALGNGPGCAQLVDTGLAQLAATGTVQQIPPSSIEQLLKKGGPKPKIYCLTDSVHTFIEPEQVRSAAISASNDPANPNSDPFAHEWVPPWRVSKPQPNPEARPSPLDS